MAPEDQHEHRASVRNPPLTTGTDRPLNGPSSGNRFRKHERLRRQADFDRVFAGGVKRSDSFLILYAAPNGLLRIRLGIRVGKHVGDAVTRNRVRRKIRESFRSHKSVLPVGLDIVCIARPSTAKENLDWSDSLPRLILIVALKAEAAGLENKLRPFPEKEEK